LLISSPWQYAIANMAIIGLGTGSGATGDVCVVGAPGIDVVVDVVGYTR
jgi:hypothetical protein